MDGNETPQIMENGDLLPNDLELARRARHGDLAAFHGLVDRHASYLFGLGVSLVGNAADAEDIVQETFFGAFRGLRGFQERSSVKTWLTQILVRQAARVFRLGRRRGPGVVQFDAESPSGPSVPSGTARADAQMDVNAAILSLRPDHREVIVLRELEGMSYEEIAQALAIPRGTVESRLHRARQQLREVLRDYLM